MSAGPLETGDMMVVTVRVPTTSAADLSITVADSEVRVLGPDGFRHEVTLPEADLERLQAQLYRGILELRAPHSIEPAPPAGYARAVGIEALE
jgi:HSP20 family molecular chaperone IbpA